jgi:prepilin-type N-terminal cleavage/methylation domain-containing protein
MAHNLLKGNMGITFYLFTVNKWRVLAINTMGLKEMLIKNKGRLTFVFSDGSVGREGGFTIIELMCAAALSLIVMAGIYSVYRSQQKSYIVREQETVMQQNLRAGMVVITSDIRMAGYVHPSVTPAVAAGITSANPTSLEFTLLEDKTDAPASNGLETISYTLDVNKLKRTITHSDATDDGGVIIAENIDWLDFVYLDINGNETATLADIKSIQITMVAKTGRGDPDYVDTNVYTNQQSPPETILPAPNDNFRRRKLSREIRCRNL